jgi:HAD superfamily hydrolase (TIGR01549 family)
MLQRSAIIFDLDGTITKPFIDFDAIRRDIGIASGTILEAMAQMDAAARSRAEEIVLRHEWDAARNGDIYDDAVEVLEACRANGYATAVLTRNARAVVNYLIDRHKLHFNTIRTREDGAVKPSPEPVYSICRELQVDPRDSWIVGDFLYDIKSGRSAGTGTILMIGEGAVPEYAGQADFMIRRLSEIPTILDFAGKAVAGSK